MKTPPRHRLHIWKSARHIALVTGLIALAISFLVAAAIAAHADLSRLFWGLLLSTWRVTLAYCISLFLALALGIFVMKNSFTESALLPILDVIQSFPSFALLPVVIKFFGDDTITVVIILVINIIWPITFAVIGGIKTLRTDLEEAATIFGATGWKRLTSFLVPGLFPAMVTGSIIGWGEGWEAVVGAEIIAGKSGIGGYIADVTASGETRLLVLTLVVLMFVVFMINNWVWLRLLKKTAQWGE